MGQDLEDLRIYSEAMALGEEVWGHVEQWDAKAFRTIGDQVTRSCDSVAANISEGYGRYHHKERMRFCYIARGSLRETKTWLTKAKTRKFIPATEASRLIDTCETLRYKIDAYIKSIAKLLEEDKKR